MFKTILLIVLAAICAHANPADKVLNRVRIVVKSSGHDLPTEGRLYKVLEGQNSREFIANVAADGTLDAPFKCKSPARIWAEPKRLDVTSAEEPQPCGGSMVFQFLVPMIAHTSSFAKGMEFSSAGKAGAAHRAFSEVAAAAVAQGDARAAAVASNAALATAATVLGDKNLSTMVAGGNAQNKGLVLTTQGKQAVMDYQRDAKINVTGKLDFPTQKAMAKIAD